jgi:hypothetical protein
VVLGYSLAFGYGVEDDQAWPEVVNRAWPKVRVVHLGIMGAGPQQYLQVYETFGRKLQPRVLLVGFLARNDFWEAGFFDRWLRPGGVQPSAPARCLRPEPRPSPHRFDRSSSCARRSNSGHCSVAHPGEVGQPARVERAGTVGHRHGAAVHDVILTVRELLSHGVLELEERPPQVSQATVAGTLWAHRREQMPQSFRT